MFSFESGLSSVDCLARSRLFTRGVAGVAAVALLVTLTDLPIRPAAAQAAPPTARAEKPPCPAERPDEAAALATARLCGAEVKIAGLTNETDEAWGRPDGSVRWEHRYRPVRVQRDGAWMQVNTDLEHRADGSVGPKVAATDVSFSGGGDDPMVSIGRDGRELRLDSPLGSLPEPVLTGDVATYPDVLPGVDLRLRADVDGFSQVFVIKSRDAAQSRELDKLDFGLTGDGLTLRTDKAGNLKVVDPKGNLAFTGGVPTMWDTPSGPTTSDSPPVDPAEPAGGEVPMPVAVGADELAVTPDQRMLDDPRTTFPVYVDPGLTVNRSAWTLLDSATPTTSYWNSTMLAKIGSPNGTAKRRSIFNLAAAGTPMIGKHVIKATFDLQVSTSNSCTPTPIQLYSMVSSATATTTWNTQSAWSVLQDTFSTNKGGGPACPAGLVRLDATQNTQVAARGGANMSLGIRAVDETAVVQNKQFANNPILSVTYTGFPTLGARTTVPASTCTTGAGRPFVNTATPTLKASYTDPESGPTAATFEWWPVDGTAALGTGTQGAVPVGTAAAVSIPAGQLVDGRSYKWRVRAFDGAATTSWSSWCEFTVDTTVPAAPAVTSSTYPADTWAGATGTAGTFSLGASGASDVTAYVYGVDTNPPTSTVNASGGNATVTYNPTADGPHVLYVRSRDRAGNLSPLTSYRFNVGMGAVLSPSQGDLSSGISILEGAGQPTATGLTFQWRRGDADAWTWIPSGHVTLASGGAVSWPLQTTGNGAFPRLNWNVAATADNLDGPLQVRAVMDGRAAGVSTAVTFSLDRNRASAAAAEVGPGSVNLATGNLTLSDTDVSVDAYGSDLTVTRSYNSRRATETDAAGMFGPGWVSGVVVEEADAPYTTLTRHGSLVQVGLPDGDNIGFAARTAAVFDPEPGMEGLKLSYAASGDSFTLNDEDGNNVAFTRVSGSPAGTYHPTRVTVPGNGQTTTISWQKAAVDGKDVYRPVRMLAPVPGGVESCTTLVKGCRALTFDYAATTTATAAAPADYAGRVRQVNLTAFDPDLAAPAMRTVALARYAYDHAGRLRSTWDPRLDHTVDGVVRHLADSYDYDADGVLSSVTSAGQPPWQLRYTTVPGDPGKGRLATATRTDPGAGAATSTVVYAVPVAGAGAPHDVSAAQLARWGQVEPPVLATAVFPSTEVPSVDQAAGARPSSYERATITYLDASARAVNSAAPGGHLSTTWFDEHGNSVRELGAGNRRQALDASTSDVPAEEAALAERLSTANVYSDDGLRLLHTFGPEHDVSLGASTIVRGRTHTSRVYDEGAPADGGLYNLVTTETTSVRHTDADGKEVDSDARTTRTAYDWTLRQPIRNVEDPDGVKLTTRTAYDAVTGLVTAVTTAAGGEVDTTPSTRRTVHYRAGTGSGHAECDSKPHWANLACRVQTGGQPGSGPELPYTVTTYDMFNRPRTVVERTAGGVLRTSTTTYDAAGRPYETAVTAAAGLGAAVPITRNLYDPATGQLTTTQSVLNGAVTAQVSRGYDALGRQVSYTDADGVTSTTGYDRHGRVTTTFDGRGTRTFAYDQGNERRGLATSVVDSHAGTFTGAYDADGTLISEVWPSGLGVSRSHDETGEVTGVSYRRPGCTDGDCVVYDDRVGDDAHGQRRRETSTLGSWSYDYDRTGRLTQVTAAVEGVCTVRGYQLSTATNRTRQVSYGPADDGGCQTGTAAETRTWTYDTADRVTGAGYTYDALGRTLTVPSVDTGNAGGVLTVGYHVTDLVKSLRQNGRTAEYTLDVTGERIRSWTDAAATGDPVESRHHYDGDDDSPAWTQEDGGFTRPVAGLGGLAGIYTSHDNTLTYQLANVLGSIVATVRGADVGLSATHAATTEFGAPLDPARAGDTRYGWLGTHQRAADTPTGVILMGVRLYNATTGRFLSTDPVYGGSANAYEYCAADPVNCTDLDGKWRRPRWTKWRGWRTVWRVAAIVGTAAATLGCGVSIVCGLAAGAAIGAMGYWGTRGRKTWRGTAEAAGWGAATGFFGRTATNAWKVARNGKWSSGSRYRRHRVYSEGRFWRNMRPWARMTRYNHRGHHRRRW